MVAGRRRSRSAADPVQVGHPFGDSAVRLSSASLDVLVLPDAGCDIVSVRDLRTGIDVMFRTPWAGQAAEGAAWGSESRWLAAYPGGWQVLCPNAGEERTVAGAVQGFHGEAALTAWQVLDRTEVSMTCRVSLFTAPLELTRTIEVAGPVVRVTESVHNTSPDPCPVVWMHHPGFGEPLVGPSARMYLPGGVVVGDAVAPGTLLAPDSRHRWPHAEAVDGRALDLSDLTDLGDPREVFGCVVDAPEGWFALTNPEHQLGVAMCWDRDVFPFTWLWQEVHATPAFPWFRRVHVVGVEPSNVMPGHGVDAGRGQAPSLDGGGSTSTTLELTVFTPTADVVHVAPGGRVEQAGI